MMNEKDILKYDSLNEKLRLAIQENCLEEIDEYKEEMNKLLMR